MSNCAAAQSVKRSTAPAGSGTIFGSPVEPEVVSMNEMSSPPPAGGHCDGSTSSSAGVSSIARRLRALAARAVRLEHAARARLREQLGERLGRQLDRRQQEGPLRLQAGEDQRNRLRRLPRADADRAVGGELGDAVVGRAPAAISCELAVVIVSPSQISAGASGWLLRLCGEVVEERFAHPDPWPTAEPSAARCCSNSSTQLWTLPLRSSPVPISSPLKPAAISSAPTFGIGDRAGADRAGRPRPHRGLEHASG